jgi:RHH-type proline utilization regulon transcriptional repressor/proline dehydrogenase/delta 1-pyrroline-5-carboxylate dehydrogenase
MSARSLDEAIDWQNSTGYGLTGGLHALDSDEIDRWLARVEVGNAYINRHITGAIVGRQPFGGWKRSAVGPTAKAGGPNYVATLVRCSPSAPLDVGAARGDFARAWTDRFAGPHDPTGLACEADVLRYQPVTRGVIVRVDAAVTDDAVAIARLAARTAGTSIQVSSPAPRSPQLKVVVEDDEQLAERLATAAPGRLRLLGETTEAVRRAAHRAGVAVDDAPVLDVGELELIHWVREQAVSATLHRHGLIGSRPAAL